MLIKGGTVFLEDGTFSEKDIRTEGSYFADIADRCEAGAREPVIDAGGLYVIPGLVDIHFHGCDGYDFCDASREALDAITRYEAGRGITSICPATMTLSRKELEKVFRQAGAYPNERDSRILGITMEGPFLSAAKKGAQKEKYIRRPDCLFFREMQRLCGSRIVQAAVAPEEDEDFGFIREISAETVVSVAHTTADYDTASAAFAAGASHVTHLFNAMPPFSHRAPGVVGAALDAPGVYVEMICDGIHVHPAMVRAAFSMFGADRVCMISDSMRAAGKKDGEYTLGGQRVSVRGKRAALEDGTIAGSVSDLMDCLRTAVKEMGIPPEDAVTACTKTPAKSLGLYDRCGSIAAGKSADAVILDHDFRVVQVICRGKPV